MEIQIWREAKNWGEAHILSAIFRWNRWIKKFQKSAVFGLTCF